MSVVVELQRRSSLDTDQAHAFMDPRNPLKVLHLPRSQVRSMSKMPDKGRARRNIFAVEIPTWLAEENNLDF